jgi:hypothetical protein
LVIAGISMSFPAVSVREPRLESPVSYAEVGLDRFVTVSGKQVVEVCGLLDSVYIWKVGESGCRSNQSPPRGAHVGFGCRYAVVTRERSSIVDFLIASDSRKLRSKLPIEGFILLVCSESDSVVVEVCVTCVASDGNACRWEF